MHMTLTIKALSSIGGESETKVQPSYQFTVSEKTKKRRRKGRKIKFKFSEGESSGGKNQ